jgi:hypothetical protein
MNLPKDWWNYFICFDVESMGLHGPAFAVGAVVFKDGIEIETLFARTKDFYSIRFDQEDFSWVNENVLPNLEPPTHDSGLGMEDALWELWIRHSAEGAVLVADVIWPVEAKFLSDIINPYKGNFVERKWKGPYPLIDVASIFAALGEPPQTDRLEDELPVHHPVSDARRSARKLLAVLRDRK